MFHVYALLFLLLFILCFIIVYSSIQIILLVLRVAAGLIGMMVAYALAVKSAGVHFKMLERDKIKGLKKRHEKLCGVLKEEKCK